MRFAIIGSGGMARAHIRVLNNKKLLGKEVEIVALADPEPQSMEKALNEFPALKNARLYSDYKELLNKEQLDAAIIASPHTAHYEQVIDCLEKGINVFVEKPMVCCVAHAEKITELAEEKGLTVMIGYQRRFMPALLYAKEVISSGKLGKLLFISAYQAQNWLPAALYSWRGVPELAGGGQITDSGSHLVHAILWLTEARPLEVFAYMEKEEAKVDILSALAVKFENGILGSIGIIGDNPGWGEEISIWGKKGAIIIKDGWQVTQQGEDGKYFNP
ncbi:Gfo/Idh/MocA family oxidoreductase, partial [bacterium]|nr:Gfo/Idh/MocA family oxidoreductase [bacterium]